MKIVMVTPAGKGSRSGNRATAMRWGRLIRELGHRVDVTTNYVGGEYELMVALHAWRSADAVRQFRKHFAIRPLVVALTGTDLYEFIHSHSQDTLGSIALANRLVALHELAAEAIPAGERNKVKVIYQSAKPMRRLPPNKRTFDVCVAGHLRDVKDPLQAAMAVRDLPESSRLRVLHFGRAHDAQWAKRGRAEARWNKRYEWFGEVPNWRVRRAYAKCRLMVLSSTMEGGANVVSEAVVAGLPVIASDIPGSVGLLGTNYPGYFPVGDTQALRALLLRAEREPKYLKQLREHCAKRAPLFTPERERAAWHDLLQSLESQ